MKNFLLFLILISSLTFHAQSVSINKDNSNPDSSAILDVKSTDQGVLIPRMKTQEMMNIPNPAAGLMIWNIETNSLQAFDGIDWLDISSKWKKDGSNIVNANNGNIGIGGSSNGADIYIKRPAPDIWLYDESTSNTSGTIQGDSSNLHIFASRALVLSGNNPGHLILQPKSNFGPIGGFRSGNVGIDIENPAYRLSLNGEMGLYNGTSFFGRLGHHESNLVINSKLGSTIGIIGNPPPPPEDILLQANTGGSVFVRTGNVGINTLVPTAKFHVNGNVMIGAGQPADDYLLSVGGRIMGEEMRIENASGWPDYVFAKDYELAPLKKLSDDIDQLGHLPGIPSAEEVETGGLLLGDMVKRQMEKIEELTLYILQLNKRIETLEKK